LLLSGAGACSGGGTDPGGGGGSYDHSLSPGASANDLLSADAYDRLIVQVQYVEGHRPSDAGLQHLEDFLNARLNKPSAVVMEIDAPLRIQTQAIYSTADVRAIEQRHRTAYTEGTTLAIYMLFLDGEYAGEPNVLGIAYNNTSMAVFEEKIEQYTGGPVEPPAATVEGAVASHEVGHLLGLVNNGTTMQRQHQDEPNGHHCDDPDCLMYYAVRTTDFIANLLGGVPTLDQDCLDDLQANGGK
jgi:hypothetical protein